ncbi:hypothetical protein H5P28_06000 [Ruficoccus amylovorans]|uniref:Autotransporter-associated beta strand repeat protein n=1 Tax=Ruficoccus amylovorans TaxID=1804625 RepID=A0A842HC95_9BACT|nr:hypothetical protein [Ruficoccus amylovorans]MBC2593809.1 hypothetical protein [Ruficoccus amylovorans]
MKTIHRIYAVTSGVVSLYALIPNSFAVEWTGSGATPEWTIGENWQGGIAPVNDGTAVVDYVLGEGGVSVVDQAWSIGTISFLQGAGSYQVSGEMLTISGSNPGVASSNYIIRNRSSSQQFVSNDLQLSNHGVIWAENADLTLTGAMNIDSGLYLYLQAQSEQALTISGNISGDAGTLALNGGGSVELSGTNAFTANTRIKVWGDTTLVLSSDGALGNVTKDILLGSDSTTSAGTPALLTNGAITVTQTIRLTSSSGDRVSTVGGKSAHVSEFTGNILLNGTYPSNVMPLIVTAAEGGRVNVRGSIVREGHATGDKDTITKTGLGIVALYGNANHWSGETLIESGTLIVNGILSAGGGSVIAKDGATLAGVGTINRNVLIKTGATLSAGDIDTDGTTSLTGILAVNGNLSSEDGSFLLFDVGDRLNIDGDVAFGASTVSFSNIASWSDGRHLLISYTGNMTANELALALDVPSGWTLDATTTGEIAVIVIPEAGGASIFLGIICSLITLYLRSGAKMNRRKMQ